MIQCLQFASSEQVACSANGTIAYCILSETEVLKVKLRSDSSKFLVHTLQRSKWRGGLSSMDTSVHAKVL